MNLGILQVGPNSSCVSVVSPKLGLQTYISLVPQNGEQVCFLMLHLAYDLKVIK